ncbi:MAG: 2-aminoethylphosphonate--pyruvate transaminase [Phycisphaeraceae bacterium]|nr:2-aminoethylphosphonate--pyruvate transaminase [Phycisphaeraceae bacterium]
MAQHVDPSSNTDPLLFTPGPLTTSGSVKRAMQRDLGSRDQRFVETVARIRARLLALAGAEGDRFASILVQGAGTFGIESVFASCTPPDGKWLIVANGAYGERMVQMLDRLAVPCAVMRSPEDRPPEAAAVASALDADSRITHLAIVHCETTTGIMNDIGAVGHVARERGRRYFVDAMSSFGAIEIDPDACGIDYLVSSSNKCIEGVPGFSFVIARREALSSTRGWARSLSLDLLASLEQFEKNGQFRFTPPTHAILAFDQALTELVDEGGVAARGARYRQNREVLHRGMTSMGFRAFLDEAVQGPIISTYLLPEDGAFEFGDFYDYLSNRNLVIYPGKLTQAPSFRIGTIGRIAADDIERLLGAIADFLAERGIHLDAGT